MYFIKIYCGCLSWGTYRVINKKERNLRFLARIGSFSQWF